MRLARAIAIVALFAGLARAHALFPALLDVHEHGDGSADVLWRFPNVVFRAARFGPVLPAGCRDVAPRVATQETTTTTVRWTVECGASGLIGGRIEIAGLGVAQTDALVRIALADGRVVQQVLRAREPFMTVPARARPLAVLRDYCRLGIEHILGGPDHLLFVFGLLLLVPTRRLLIRTVTAFTAGHSVTLSLAVLDVARVPSRPAELLIAMTVLTLAVELARETASPTLMRRFPWVMALGFGLLHGLGFAGALREVGLPSGEIPTALFSFNVGIEIGQLLFVVVVLGAGAVLARLAPPGGLRTGWLGRVPVYAMGCLAAFWCFQRAALLLH